MSKKELKHESGDILSQLLLALPLSLVGFALLAIMVLLGFEVAYANRVYPGVHVHDLELSGMTLEETDQRLAEALQYADQGLVQFMFEDQVWEAPPHELGYRIDPETSAEAAYAVGRKSWLPINLLDKGRAWFTGVQISPVTYYDERVAMNFLQAIASEVDRPVKDASIRLESAQVIAEESLVGIEMDIPATLELLRGTLLAMEDSLISVIIEETQPLIVDVRPQAELARRILSEPLELSVPDNDQSWTIHPEELASMLVIQREENGEPGQPVYQIAINESLFTNYLASLAPSLSLESVNTRFIFNDDTRQLEVIEPAVIGRKLDVEKSVTHINDEVIAGAHNVDLQFHINMPEVTDDTTAEELGITELIREEISYFYGSDPPRVQNIAASSASFHGLLIAPGETFSMVQALDDISLDNGYAEAPIIFGGRTIQGIGGGVCQVSTTLFRAAFFAGFPIDERHPHSYRVGYYEQRSNGNRDVALAGLDASVYVPIVDLKFTNDTDHWLLMETYPGSVSLTWKFYSTSDGRTVETSSSGLTNIIPAPDTLYRENPDLAQDQTKRVDYAAEGADVRVNRTVYLNGQVHFSDSIFTRYQPWQEIIEYGPGTEGIPESNGD